ncbi:ras-related protein Rab-34 [Leptonychotes weddellii]|uniref:Ras-related protein Rab-34 n=1 Tax=Leptonychotes weddellii TaxID=9713 RepID=A0A7F8QLM1_LEPWE|nr:ras-related protein Rab-34 [Leptonychotes weddellii]XP_030882112.1 ras-related protein Rab-34 [Leptonychotes weddellii]
MSHVLGLELREAPPLLGPLLSSFPLPAGSWPSQILRSNHRFSITNLTGAREGRAEWDAGPCSGLGPWPPPPAGRGPCSAIPAHTDPVRRGRSAPPGGSVMVGPPQPRAVVGSPRPRVIVGTIRPRVIVGSARARAPPDGTPRPHLEAEESPRPRVVVGTTRARVIVGSPRPRMIVSSPWPAVVVASPRPRAPVGSPWPRVIVGTPRSRVIVGSPRARVAGADQAPAPSRGSPQGRRRDEHSGAGAEGPRPGGAAPVPEEGGRFARAQRLPPPRHLRLPGAPDRHRGVS